MVGVRFYHVCPDNLWYRMFQKILVLRRVYVRMHRKQLAFKLALDSLYQCICYETKGVCCCVIFGGYITCVGCMATDSYCLRSKVDNDFGFSWWRDIHGEIKKIIIICTLQIQMMQVICL